MLKYWEKIKQGTVEKQEKEKAPAHASQESIKNSVWYSWKARKRKNTRSCLARTYKKLRVVQLKSKKKKKHPPETKNQKPKTNKPTNQQK